MIWIGIDFPHPSTSPPKKEGDFEKRMQEIPIFQFGFLAAFLSSLVFIGLSSSPA